MPRTNKPYVAKRSSALARLRIRAKLTLAKAAEQLGIAPGTLGNIEHGVRASDELQAKIAEVYGVSLVAVRRAYLEGRRDFIVRERP
jgi:transcriptional regulator with XRE-family HTH domain